MRNKAHTHIWYEGAASVLFRIFLGLVLGLSCFPIPAFAQEDASLTEIEASDEETSGEGEDDLGTGESSSASDADSSSVQGSANAEFVAEGMTFYDAISLSLEISSTFSVDISGVAVSFRVSAEGEVVVEGDPSTSTPAIASDFEGSLVIPEKVEFEGVTYKVVGIGDYAFYYCEGLEQISLPEGILSIGGYAFYYCTGLKEIGLQEGVISIGDRAFYRCETLSGIDLPETLEEIGTSAFFRCRSFTTLYIPASVKIIGSNAFQMCDALETLTFAEDCVLESVGSYAFACAASYPGSLTYVEFPAANTIPDYCFQYQTSLVTVTFRGESYDQMGQGAFYGCTGLQYISIPELTNTSAPFRIRAFYGCTSLTDVIWLADAEGYASSTGSVNQSDHPFYGCTSITNVVSYGTRWVYSSGYGAGGGSISDEADASYPYTEAELHYYYNVTFYGSQSDAESSSNAIGSARLRDDVSILQINTDSFEEGQVYDDGGALPSLGDDEAWLFEDELVVDDTISESCYAYKGSAFDVAAAQISFSQDPYYYTAASIDVEFTVISAKGAVLSQGTDFTIVSIIMDGDSYELDSIVRVGSYTLSIAGEGSYTGSRSAIFTVEYATIEETVYEGDDIVAMAASVSSALYAADSLTTVLLVPTDYPEIALVCSVYAAQLGWSILFVEKDSLPSETATEIRRLSSTQVIVVGSTSLVASDVTTTISSLSNRPSVSRINASDSTEAAYLLWQRFASNAGLSDASTVYLCASSEAAAAVSAYAARVGIPILFCEESGQVTAQTRSLLKTSSFENMVVVGGTSSAAETLSSIVGRPSVQYSLLACKDAGSLSIQMAELMEDEGLCESSEVVVAGVGDAAGSACAALLAASLGAVMLLADNDETGQTLVDDYLSSRINDISGLIFVGTEDGLTSSTRQALLDVWELLGSGSAQVKRLAGSNRYETMAAIVSAGFKTSDVVILASGEKFPDALAGSGLAGYLNAPIVLTGSDPTQAIETISSLGASKIYVLGDSNTISESVVSQITAATGATAERIAGTNRQKTALAITEKMVELGANPTIAIITYSEKYADALSISPYAYATGASIFLTKSDGTLSDEAIEAIEDGGYETILILGDENSVSSRVDALFPNAIRLGGTNRYATSVVIAEYAVSTGVLSYNTVAFATGENFPDALAGGPFCAVNNSVLLLVNEKAQTAFDLIAENSGSIRKIYIFGNENAVSAATHESIVAAAAITTS